jgi:tetratricopeptide (TPR) repeat protein
MGKRFQKRRVQHPVPHALAAASKARIDLQNAVALHQRGQLNEAERIYRDILGADPDHFDATHLLGVIFLQRGQPFEGEQLIARALKTNPRHSDALRNQGNALKALKRFEEALASYERAIALKPQDAETRFNRGVTLHELKRYDEALASYDRAISLRPDFAEAHSNRGATLRALKRYNEALASYDRALAVRPDYAEAHSNRGATLLALKRYEEALASCDRALALRPDYAEALSNRGVILHELRRYDEALASHDRALALRPDYAEAFSNRGATLRELKRCDEALASYERAIALKADYTEARFNRSQVLLLTGDYADGWGEYEWRSNGAATDLQPRKLACPRWQGEDLAGKTIFLYPEQGYGDTIQFCRYVALVAERGGRVILEVQKPLHELMASLTGAAQIVSTGDPLPDFDIHCPLLSLPLVLGTRLESIPSTTPYLQAPIHALQHLNRQLGPRNRPRIGICWAGNPDYKGDLSRSIGLRPMLPLLARTDVHFFSLQKDLRKGDADVLRGNQQIAILGQEIETFSGTAAIIAAMDLVISSDTSMVHLAGALGKPIWILLQFVPDWRWLLDGEDSPWYPAARLFRQDETRSWDGVIADVQTALATALERDPDLKAI